jgi:cytidylate kinase
VNGVSGVSGVSDAPHPGDRPRGLCIAIDGPGASGKSTLGAALADRLVYTYVDSGVVYRAVTLYALRSGADLGDGAVLARFAASLRIEITRPTVPDGRQYTVLLEGEDVTWALRAAAVDANVSRVSAVPEVRRAATEQLRRLISPQGTVMVGRDIGTVVLPHADLKVYLTASPEARAARRAAELAARQQQADVATILQDLRRRDAIDGSRAASPMRPADDAIRLVNDDMDVAAELAFLLSLIEERFPARAPSSDPSGASGASGAPPESPPSREQQP